MRGNKTDKAVDNTPHSEKRKQKDAFFTPEAESSPGKKNIFVLLAKINLLFAKFLAEKDNPVYQEGVTKLNLFLKTLEPILKANAMAIHYVLGAQGYYLKAICCLIEASEKKDKQRYCDKGKQYLEKAIGYGLEKDKEVAIFSEFSKTLKKYQTDLDKTVVCYNNKVAEQEEKRKNKQPVLRDKSLQVAVCEDRFFVSLTKHCTVGSVTLNNEIHRTAIEMMREALTACKPLTPEIIPTSKLTITTR